MMSYAEAAEIIASFFMNVVSSSQSGFSPCLYSTRFHKELPHSGPHSTRNNFSISTSTCVGTWSKRDGVLLLNGYTTRQFSK